MTNFSTRRSLRLAFKKSERRIKMDVNKVYAFKNEFCKELKIPMNQAERRLDELLTWLTNFFDFDFMPGRPNRIFIKEIIGEYQPLPRSLPNQDKLNAEKQEDYKIYTIASLGDEFKPNSKSKIAREAINKFGREKYHHTSAEAVVRRFVGKPFDQYIRCDYKTRMRIVCRCFFNAEVAERYPDVL